LKKAPLPPNENKRLAALKEYQVLDTPTEKDLDDLTQLACSICGTPIALISLIDECRQWFKSKKGLEANETHRDIAFCSHAILSNSDFIVPDAHKNERFSDNPLVVGPPYIRFYAGFPLKSYSGENIGTLCVIDQKPRTLEDWQIEALGIISRQVIHIFELRLLQKNAENRDQGFLASIAHNMLEGAVLHDSDGKIFMANPAAMDLLGLTKDQLLGRVPTDPMWDAIRVDGTPYPGIERPAMRALATGEAQLLKRMGIKLPDGGLRWLQVNSNLIYPNGFGGQKFVLSTFTDITKEIESTVHLRSLSEKHKLILDHIPALVAYWDNQEKCQFANQAYLEWFAISPDKLIGKSMLQLMGPPLYELNKEYIRSALSGVPRKFDRELLHRKSKEMRYTTAHYLPEIESGKVKGFYVLVFDVTEFKRLEQSAKEESKKALAASKAKSDFLANMSHEIRTPINGVMGMASLLADTSLNSTQMEYVRTIRNSSEILLSLINDILDLSKAESGMIELENIDFELGPIISNVERSFSYAANKKGIKFFRALSPDIPFFLKGDPTRLTQVMVNLVSNAIKFTSQGSVTLEASLKSLEGDDVLLNFEIADTGIGISEDALGRLFTPFSQADNSTTRQYGGTGLGLSICKHLVENMGGEIGVRSQPGKGSVFWFTIQAKVGKPALGVSPINALVESKIEKLRILIAEDNSVNQLIAKTMFEKLGHNVVAVANGKEALEALEVGNFDVVFMDCQMPVLDGYEATRQIRKNLKSSISEIPVIAMTANAMAGDREKCLNSGMNDYISKPMKLEDLASALLRNFT
jgi:PAS domain S-box-containing protein